MTAAGENSIPDKAIDDAKASIVDTIGKYVPLEKRGANFFGCCPFHGEKTPSFTVHESKQFYHCFGCGVNGDAIDFVMEYEGLDFREAVEHIVGKTVAGVATFVPRAIKPRAEPAKRPIKVVPVDAPPPDFNGKRASMSGGNRSKVWEYRNESGDLVGYVARFETRNKDGSAGKVTIPYTWAVNTETGEIGWDSVAFHVPRTLYGAELLAQRPDAPVMVVEGEKTKDAAAALFPAFVVVSWPGGGNAVDMANWPLLAGRDVVLWGDWDSKRHKTGDQLGQLMSEREQPGTKAMQGIYAHLRGNAKSIRFVKPNLSAPDGWDVADPPFSPDFTPLTWARSQVVDAAEYFERAPDQPAGPPPDDFPPPDAEYAGMPEPEQDLPRPGPVGRRKGAKADPGPIVWAKPLDVFAVRQPPELPIDLLPVCMQDYVREQGQLTGCDPGIIGLGALVAAAACIDDGIRLQPKRHDRTWTESARLWVAFVGDPSTKKSPAISKAVRHVKRIDHNMAESNGKAMGEFKGQQMAWKEAKKQDRNLPTPEPKQPAMQRLLVEDITVEALTEVLKDNPRGVLTLKDELTGWFAGMDAYKGGKGGASMDRAHWLESYNGGRRTIDRVTRGAIVVPNWSTCIIGGIQPDMMRRIANSMGNDGLLQRFMVYCARPAGEDVDHLPDMDTMQGFREVFDRLLSVKPSEVHVVELDDDAHASRLRVAGYAKRLIGAIDHPHIQAWLGKWDGLYGRLLLTYHTLLCSQMGIFPANAPVTKATAEQVERLMCSVLLPHALHFYTEIIDANDRQEHVRQLARMILARKVERVTLREISQFWKTSRKLERWELRAVIEVLGTLGWLEPNPLDLDTDGKPKSWAVNPDVHEAFAEQGQAEAERRRRATETLREMRERYDLRQA